MMRGVMPVKNKRLNTFKLVIGMINVGDFEFEALNLIKGIMGALGTITGLITGMMGTVMASLITGAIHSFLAIPMLITSVIMHRVVIHLLIIGVVMYQVVIHLLTMGVINPLLARLCVVTPNLSILIDLRSNFITPYVTPQILGNVAVLPHKTSQCLMQSF